MEQSHRLSTKATSRVDREGLSRPGGYHGLDTGQCRIELVADLVPLGNHPWSHRPPAAHRSALANRPREGYHG